MNKPGTVNVEPGTGATWGDVARAVDETRFGHPPGLWSKTEKEWNSRTNVQLTGEPLTADDIKRISEAQ